MIDYLCIIQARLGSTRFPNKVMQTVGGVPMVKRVWAAAKQAQSVVGTAKMKVIVAWPERYPDLDESNVLERFQRISNEFPSKWIIRLTSDCPLIKSRHIVDVICAAGLPAYYHHDMDGFDVQMFPSYLLDNSQWNHREHVINPKMYKPYPKFLSVDTKEDLERVRAYGR